MFLFSVQLSHGLDWVFQGYLPSLLKIVSGDNAFVFQLEESVDNRFILPFEFKFSVGKLGPVGITASGMLSYYSENDIFASMNMSAGFGVSFPRRYRSPLEALYINLLPVYEFPVVPFGKTPFFKWKSAIDIGLSFDLFSNVYINLYARSILLWSDSKTFNVVPDIGIAVGWHFKDKEYWNVDRSF
jgi:hypothetical protein